METILITDTDMKAMEARNEVESFKKSGGYSVVVLDTTSTDQAIQAVARVDAVYLPDGWEEDMMKVVMYWKARIDSKKVVFSSSMAELKSIVCLVFGVTWDQLLSYDKFTDLHEARTIFARCAFVKGCNFREIAKEMKRQERHVIHRIKTFNDARRTSRTMHEKSVEVERILHIEL